jgi:hypothetical protein
MAISAAEPAGAIQRGRGGFMRNALDVPYVTDPSGAVVKSGERKGEPKRLAYGSPSGFGKQIENTYNLAKWGERQTVLGIGVDLALIADCAVLATMDRTTDEFKAAADRVVMRAKDAAQTSLAADRGTHAHALAEDDDEGRNWIQRAEAGELLGIPREAQAALVQAWRDMLVRDGLEVLVTEASCVDDTWRLAGTLDNLARLTKPLRFALVSGEVVTIPADTVVVLDKKTGQRRVGRDGTVMYWHGYAVQVASYAQSVPYDTETEVRGTWPWEISQQHALIAHLDVLGAIEGNPSCELVYVDLVAGREHGGATVVRAKEWERRKDVFSVGRLTDENVTAGASGRETEDAPASGPTPAVTPTAAPAPPAVEQPTEGAGGLPVATAPSVIELPTPDEGGPADPAAVEALKKRYLALPKNVRSGWLKVLAEQAITGMNGRGRVPYLLTGDQGLHTVRRFEITRGLVLLAEGGSGDDETLRCVCAAVIGELAHWPTISAGQVVGSLGADEAALFARLCDELANTTVPAAIDEATGRVVLQFPHLAA